MFDKTNWRSEKIVSLGKAKKIAEAVRKEGKNCVTVNGSFDLVHIGHLDQLEDAKKQGNVLFVGVNSDSSIKEYKGEERPFVPEEARAAMLAAFECVDYVIVIDEKAEVVANVLIRAIKPAVHVNGADYGVPEEWIEWFVMKEVGAKGHVVKKINDLSTSEIVEKIRG